MSKRRKNSLRMENKIIYPPSLKIFSKLEIMHESMDASFLSCCVQWKEGFPVVGNNHEDKREINMPKRRGTRIIMEISSVRKAGRQIIWSAK